MTGDPLAIMHAWLLTVAPLAAIVGTRIYTPRLPEKATLPALSFFIRGGSANAHIPPIPSPSFQFDCWGTTPQEARSVYIALYDALQGAQNVSVVLPGPITYRLMCGVEEVQGQDIQPVDPKDYDRVLGLFSVTMEV